MIKTKRKILIIVISVLVIIGALTAVFYLLALQKNTDDSFSVVIEAPKPYKIEIISEPNFCIGKIGVIRIIGLETRDVNKIKYSSGYGYALAEGLKEIDSKYNIADVTSVNYHSQTKGRGGSETVELIILVNEKTCAI